MFKKPSILLIILSAFTVGFFLSLIPKHDQLNETLIFFPLDPDALYTEAKTSLDFLTSKDADEYILKWNVKSLLNQTSYLRQDVSLLFEDGYLKDTLSLWKEDADLIQLEKEVFGEDSGHYEAITLHHAEIHYPNDVLKSAQMMSFDQLYVFDSPLSSFHAFKIPETTEEEEGKRILDYILQQQMTFLKGDLLEHFSIPPASYESIPLSGFARFQNESLPGLDEKQTAKFLSTLWEVLYKNYVLGIQNQDGHILSPIGSTVPLILLPKQPDHFLILFRTSEGEPIQLLQTLSF